MLAEARNVAVVTLGHGGTATSGATERWWYAGGVARHHLHGNAMLAGVQALGLTVFGDTAHKMNNIVGVHIPDGADDVKVRAGLLEDFGIEIGSSFGPLRGRIWRIGTMGLNARHDAVLLTLAALEQVLRAAGTNPTPGAGVAAAKEVYAA